MTPSELAAMVDRLAPQITPGGWVASDPHGDGSYYEILGRDAERHTYPILGDMNDQDDAEAVALVPGLMAENQRMRRKLEARIRVWGKVANKLESVDHMSSAEVVRHHIGQLTRILEGENHE